MKYALDTKHVLVITVFLLLVACSSTPGFDMKNHTGCANGSIGPNGTCRVAEDDNAAVFDVPNLNERITSSNTTVNGVPGYLAKPTGEGSHPGVVMIHEWWGLNANIRHMADVLASRGYVVFAVDLYDGAVANTSDSAMELSNQVRDNQEQATDTLQRAALGVQELSASTDAIASLGWCFGGGQSLQLAISGASLNATVIYYGSLTSNTTQLQRIDWPVLGLFGGEDRVVSTESVHAFNASLNSLDIPHSVKIYDGAGHAFANPSGDSFRPNATRDAWNRTLQFLDQNLR